MKAVVDRIENGIAVLLIGDNEVRVDFPLYLLPQGAREGSFLTIKLELDPSGEAAQRQKIANLLEKLKSKK